MFRMVATLTDVIVETRPSPSGFFLLGAAPHPSGRWRYRTTLGVFLYGSVQFMTHLQDERMLHRTTELDKHRLYK